VTCKREIFLAARMLISPGKISSSLSHLELSIFLSPDIGSQLSSSSSSQCFFSALNQGGEQDS
jgi:hypothetical protein